MRACWLIVMVAGCTAKNPLYCQSDVDCTNGVCDVGSNTCTGITPDALPMDAALPADAAVTVDAAAADAASAIDAAGFVCTSTCPLCNQYNRACCGNGCCGFGEWCDTNGPMPTCRCGTGNSCSFNTSCCAAAGQCGLSCRASCF
jgi:hypothetical protein